MILYMKRFFIIVLTTILAVCPLFSWADSKEYSDEQLTLRDEISKFLQEEGFMPEFDPNDNLKFKSEGRSYYVSISAVDENPMYITLYIPFNNPDNYSADAVVMATKSLNRYKGVKVVCFDKSFRISAELYLRDANLFKESFYKLMSQIDSVRRDFIDECKNVGNVAASISEIPFIVTKMEVANVTNDGTIIQDYGTTIYDFKTQYLKPRITIKPYKTSGAYTVYVKLYKNNVLQRNTSSSPENYTYSTDISINDSSSQIKALPGWGSKKAGNWSIGTYRYEVWINGYCIGSTTFKVI